MPPLSSHQSATSTKLLFIGDSGVGKTGALASLAAAGYNLRILDFDNGLDILKNYLSDPNSSYLKASPKAIENVTYITCTDQMKTVAGTIIPLRAFAWQRAVEALHQWKETDPADKSKVLLDLGKIETWGERDILVIDSLSMVAEAAKNYHLQLNGKLGQSRTSNEARRDIGATQQLIRTLLQMLYSDSIKCNVIVTSHITLVTESGLGPQSEDAKGNQSEIDSTRGYPSAIGRALSPHIPRYFNTVLFADVEGVGPGARHYIYTKSRGNVLVKTTAPLRVKDRYDLASGLAEYFSTVRG